MKNIFIFNFGLDYCPAVTELDSKTAKRITNAVVGLKVKIDNFPTSVGLFELVGVESLKNMNIYFLNEIKNDIQIIVTEINTSHLNAYIKTDVSSFSLGTKKNDLESWIEWKQWLLGLARVLNAKLINETKYS